MKRQSPSSTIKELKENINTLYKTVYQGNGVPSIVSQITKLNQKVDSLEEHVNTKFESLNTEMSLKFKNITDVVSEKFNSISNQIKQEFNKEQIIVEKKWSHKTALATTLIASCSSVVILILTEILKKMHLFGY